MAVVAQSVERVAVTPDEGADTTRSAVRARPTALLRGDLSIDQEHLHAGTPFPSLQVFPALRTILRPSARHINEHLEDHRAG